MIITDTQIELERQRLAKPKKIRGKKCQKQVLELKLPADYDVNWPMEKKVAYLRKLHPPKF
jgi:hypothetical protein